MRGGAAPRRVLIATKLGLYDGHRTWSCADEFLRYAPKEQAGQARQSSLADDDQVRLVTARRLHDGCGDVIARYRLGLDVLCAEGFGPPSRTTRVIIVHVQRWIIESDDVNDLEGGFQVSGKSCPQLDSPAGCIGSIGSNQDPHRFTSPLKARPHTSEGLASVEITVATT